MRGLPSRKLLRLGGCLCCDWGLRSGPVFSFLINFMRSLLCWKLLFNSRLRSRDRTMCRRPIRGSFSLGLLGVSRGQLLRHNWSRGCHGSMCGRPVRTGLFNGLHFVSRRELLRDRRARRRCEL